MAQYGVSDFFPKLGAWMNENRQAAMQPMMDRGLERAQGLLGVDPQQFTGEGRPGGEQLQSQFGGSGLLADPEDFGTQMKFALGLMATPGFGDLGKSSAAQAMQTQLGIPFKMVQEKIKASQWQAEQDLLTGQRAGTGGQYKDQAQYNLGVNAMRDDYDDLSKPYRQAGMLLNQSQQLISLKGTTGMNIVDDEQFIKSYAKMLLPGEAVMTDDIQRIGRSESIDSLVRGLANKVGVGYQLTPTERANLYEAMVRIGSESAQQYTQLREDFAGRAVRSGFHSDDVMRTVYNIDTGTQEVSRGKGGNPLNLPPSLQGGKRATGEQQKRLTERNKRGFWDYITGK